MTKGRGRESPCLTSLVPRPRVLGHVVAKDKLSWSIKNQGFTQTGKFLEIYGDFVELIKFWGVIGTLTNLTQWLVALKQVQC